MTAVSTKLREARALIERGWTQGSSARTETGDPIGVSSKCAAQWCILGAVCATADGMEDEIKALDTLEGVTDARPGYIAEWNDAPERTQADVLAAFDRAIELAEQEAR
jgi:hypothetical protein